MNLFSKAAARVFALSLLVSAVSSPIFASPVKDESVPLRVGIMPDADSMPFMLARDEGLFEREGVAVELMAFSNPQERDAALQAGKIDGAISDLLAAAFFAAGGFDVKITSLTDGRYGIAASSSSGVASLADVQGKKIGLSTNTIIQYTVDAQLEKAGIPSGSYEPVSIPRMPVRLEMLLNGQIDAASLPEPLLTAAVAQGATLLSTTDTIGVDAGIMLFLTKTLDTRLGDIQKLYRAYTAAAQKINADPDAYREYLVEKASFPAAVKDAYQFVRYRNPTLPDEAQIEQAFAWLKERDLLSVDLKASDLIDGRGIN
ncbi:MAG: ABC transporter substrate-binding protein [Treponema sp.]|jgi:NitT/TauT family transport system substrate-binding protein|nr:ABC transporter substrate-binding protein [Treponema sp.]